MLSGVASIALLYVVFNIVLTGVMCARVTAPHEIAALEIIYNSAGGPFWDWRNVSEAGPVWNFTDGSDPCQDYWQGIWCDHYNRTDRFHIHQLILSGYNLSGTISPAVSNLTELIILNLEFNDLHGSIPATLADVQWLYGVQLSFNYFTGSIKALGRLRNLEYLDVSFNQFSGGFPSELLNLPYLVFLDAQHNNFSGKIPDAAGNASQLEFLYLAWNRFTGTIPSTLCSLRLLRRLILHNNKLSQGLPAELAALQNLTALDVAHNRLTGTLPADLNELRRLFYLDLADNHFNGTVQPAWATMLELEYLSLSDNKLTGSIPVEYVQLRKLSTLRVGGNGLAGVIPDFLSELPVLYALDLSGNRFRGPIPDSLYTATGLLELDLQGNQLTGIIPSDIGNLDRLQILGLDNNQFHGKLPGEIGLLTNLTQISLSNNQFTGALGGLFDPAVQLALRVIIVNNNKLSGQLPGEIFELPLLETFVAESNCFGGGLPQTLCHARGLTALVLDGLSSACSERILPHFSHGAYLLQGGVHGQLPACLFELPRLFSLHLSGNQLSGSIPSSVQPSPTLLYLSLAHNSLTGAIPRSIQVKQWKQLNLQNNRLSGTLSSAFATAPLNATVVAITADLKAHVDASVEQVEGSYSTLARNLTANIIEQYLARRYAFARSLGRFAAIGQSLSLKNNRLSGIIPPDLHDRVNISILGTNIFECDRNHDQLPTNDTDAARYKCGSRSFEDYFYIWLASVGCLGITLVVVLVPRFATHCGPRLSALRASIVTNLNIMAGVPPPLERGESGGYSLKTIAVVNLMLDVIVRLTMASLVFSLVVLLPTYSALNTKYHTYTYMYAYVISCAYLSGTVPAVVELVLLGVTLSLVVIGFRILRGSLGPLEAVPLSQMIVEKVLVVDARLNACASFLITLLFSVVNITIVVIANLFFLRVSLRSSSVGLAVAQLALSVFKLLWNNHASLKLLRFIYHQIYRAFSMDREFVEHNYMSLLMLFAIVNNIAIPLAVTSVVSPSCFASLFADKSPITAYYLKEYCLSYYYDECVLYGTEPGSTSYVPPFQYSFQCSSSLLTSYAPTFISMCIISTLVVPAKDYVLMRWYQRAPADSLWHRALDSALPTLLKPLPSGDPQEARDGDRGVVKFTPHANIQRLAVNVLAQYATMLTFGAAFPPVAVAVAVSIVSTIYVAKFRIGRFLYHAIEQERYHYVHVVELECQELGPLALLLRKALWFLMFVKCTFTALFVYDMLGDQVGARKAVWVMVVVPLLPLLVVAGPVVYQQLKALQNQRAIQGEKRASSVPTFLSASHRELELRDISMVGVPAEVGGQLATATMSAIHIKESV